MSSIYTIKAYTEYMLCPNIYRSKALLLKLLLHYVSKEYLDIRSVSIFSTMQNVNICSYILYTLAEWVSGYKLSRRQPIY